MEYGVMHFTKFSMLLFWDSLALNYWWLCVFLFVVYRELLPLCKEVVLLLYTSGKLLANSCCGENFFTAAHSHWNTITGEEISHLIFYLFICSYDKKEFDGWNGRFINCQSWFTQLGVISVVQTVQWLQWSGGCSISQSKASIIGEGDGKLWNNLCQWSLYCHIVLIWW